MKSLVSGVEMAELDRQTIEELGVPGQVLMETAGRAVAAECLAQLGPGAAVVIGCGAGNNGGDGYVVGRILREAGCALQLFSLARAEQLKPDAAWARRSYEAGGGVVRELAEAAGLLALKTALFQAGLVVDAVFGTGLKSAVRGAAQEAIGLINDAPCPVVAVDIPSGVDADTGAIRGLAVDADTTVTFALAKRGHYLFPGAAQRGRLVVADIGIPGQLAERLGVVGRLVEKDDLAALIPARAADSHKGTFGRVVVVAGSRESPGAALLATKGALRGGAGLVSWATEPEALAQAKALDPEVMLRLGEPDEPWSQWQARVCAGASALVVGPGWGVTEPRAQALAALLAATELPVVLDADALTLLGEHPDWWARRQGPWVLTPHPREMARLTGQSVGEIQTDRFAAALALAVSRQVVVVLKGAGTVVAEPGGSVAVMDAGNAGLAHGGTGDVLAGLVGALLAQGLEPGRAACAGVLAHGWAGELASAKLGLAGVTATDVALALGEVWVRCGR